MTDDLNEEAISKHVLKEARECKRAYGCSDKFEATINNIYKMKAGFFEKDADSVELKTLPEERFIEERLKKGMILFPNLSFQKKDIRNFLHQFTEEMILLNNQLKDDLQEWLNIIDEYLSQKEEDILAAEMEKFLKDLNNKVNESMKEDKKDFTVFALTFTLASLTELSFKGKLSKMKTALWDKGSCPGCGQMPHYGMLREGDGKRLLECWLCGVSWEFPRLKCAYCHNENQDELGFFTVDNNKICRVYFCSSCNSYHKIFDMSEYARREVILPIHNFATLSYDLMAVKEGFKAGSGLEWVNDEELKV